MKRLANILGLWLWIGFAGGAAVLLLVATPIEHLLKDQGMSRGRVDVVLGGIALLWVAGSFFCAYFLAQVLRTRGRVLFAHVAGVVFSIAIFGSFVQAGDGLFGHFREGVVEWNERFTFGPFPRAEDCVKIKNEGHTGIITLLNPLVPFEAVLLTQERESAKAAGLELIETPMLPWVTENEGALDKLRDVAKSGKGRYYIHCYLGRHRADLARYVIMEALGVEKGEAPRAVLPEKFERGAITKVGTQFIIGPLPTKDEWFEYVMRTGARHVVTVLDPKDDKKWIDEEKAILDNMGLTLHVLPAESDAQAKEAAAKIKALDGIVYIHAFRPDERTEKLAALLK